MKQITIDGITYNLIPTQIEPKTEENKPEINPFCGIESMAGKIKLNILCNDNGNPLSDTAWIEIEGMEAWENPSFLKHFTTESWENFSLQRGKVSSEFYDDIPEWFTREYFDSIQECLKFALDKNWIK